MATSLYIGTETDVSGLTNKTSLGISPSDKGFYWSVTGLGSAVKNYTNFYLYDYNSMDSFTQGQTSKPSGTVISTYSNSTLGHTYFTSYMVLIPSSSIKAGNSYEFVAIAQNPGGYWAIGTTATAGQAVAFSPVGLYLGSDAWFKNAFTITVTPTGKTTANAVITHNGYNSPRYINYVLRCTEQTSYYGASSKAGSELQYVTMNSSSSSSQTMTMSITGLTAGTTNTLYFTAQTNTSYSSMAYYGLNSKSVTTDANYSATNTTTVTTTSATVKCTLNTTTNLDGKIYYSSSSGLTSKPSTYVTESNLVGTISFSGLSPNTSYTRYLYVYSSVTSTLYSVGSVTFTTSSESYEWVTEPTIKVKGSTSASISGQLNRYTYDRYIYYSSGLVQQGAEIEGSFGQEMAGEFSGTFTNLTPNKSYGYFLYAKDSTGRYVRLTDYLSFTTDASSYTATISATNITDSSANIKFTNLSPTTNLNTSWYLSTTNVSSTSSLSYSYSGSRSGTSGSRSLSGLSPETSYTYYAYVKSSASNIYYRIGSVSFTTLEHVYWGYAELGTVTSKTAEVYYESYDDYYDYRVIAGSSSNFDELTGREPWAEGADMDTVQLTGLIPGKTYYLHFLIFDPLTDSWEVAELDNGLISFITNSSIVYRVNPSNGEFEGYRAYVWESSLGDFVGLIFKMPE